jgi:hypothetical protein
VQGLEKVSVALKSPEVKKLAETLNSKLAEVQIKKALKNPGAWDKFRQKSLKQVVYLANSVSQARHDIKTVINSTLEALKALGVPLDSETKITDMFPENPKDKPPYQFKTKITKEEFKKGIINKLGESGKSGVLSFFKNLMGSIKLDKSVVINPEFFSNNILFNTPKELSEVYKQPIISEPSATKIDDSVRAAAEAAPKDASGKSGEAAVGGEAEGGEGGEVAELATPSAPAASAVVTLGAAPSGEGSDLVAECEALLAELGELRELPGMTEFVCACREGKTRSIERVLSPTSVTELVETRAQQALCDGLEASVAGGHIKIAKLLIDGGADVHRTSALHIAIRHGQIALMQHLVTTVAVSVNGRDSDGASPLHIAAEFNQPKAAQYLLRNSAFVDSTDGKGRTPLEVAVAFKWKEMQRVLGDPSLLFWNRAARATKLYKASEYEPACECYARAQIDMDRMPTAPEPANVATFNFNWGRSSQALGRFSEGLRLFSKVLAAESSHQRALDHRAECHCKLDDHESALADLTELQTKFATTADEATLKGWVKRVAEIRAEQRKSSHEVLGLARDASEAEVRKAYRQLCLNWHPDKHASSTEDQRERARHRFCRIQAAYEKLQAAAKASSSPFSGFESAYSGYARRTSA